MSLTLITPPTSEPVSLAEARAHLRETGTEEDGLIAGYLLAAREFAETHTGRALMAQTWDQTEDALGDGIRLRKTPVALVTSVQYLDADGVEQMLASDQYRVVRRAAGETVIVPAFGVVWPATQAVEGAVTVRYVAGYGTGPGVLPEAIRQAILLLVGHWFANREAVNAGAAPSELPMGVEALLFPHRVLC
jgi:uncharacterized phiE125 gp8 family phage protein